MDELPAKRAAMEVLNYRHKQISLPAERQRDIRIIGTRWAQVSCEHYGYQITKCSSFQSDTRVQKNVVIHVLSKCFSHLCLP